MTETTDDVLDDVLEALETVLDPREAPVATAPEVADALPYDRKRRRVLEDLRALERAGEVASKPAGAKARVWWRTPPQHSASARPTATATDTPPANADARDAPTGADDRDRLRDLVVGADLPGKTPERLEERRDALEATLAYIRDHGEARRRDLFADVYPDHPAGYDSDGSWWKNAIQPALSALADDVDELEKATPHRPWRWE